MFNVPYRDNRTGDVQVMQLPLNLLAISHELKQYLMICSPGVKHVRELEEVIPSTYSNMC
jgi:hypothetical protein